MFTIPHPTRGSVKVTARAYIDYRYQVKRGHSLAKVLQLTGELMRCRNLNGTVTLQLTPVGWVCEVTENEEGATFVHLSSLPWTSAYMCIAKWLVTVPVTLQEDAPSAVSASTRERQLFVHFPGSIEVTLHAHETAPETS